MARKIKKIAWPRILRDAAPFAVGICALILLTIAQHVSMSHQQATSRHSSLTKATSGHVALKAPVSTPKPAPSPVATTTTTTIAPPTKTVASSSSPTLPTVTPSPTSSVSSLTPTAPASSGSSSSTPTTTTSYTSTNWSGYLATAGSYNQISSSWVVPHVSGNGVSTSADSAWIGIGGVTSGDLIQVGTDDTVSASGQVSSGAFYELLPAFAQTIPGVSVSAGDSMSAAINEVSSGQWLINITDNTNGQSFTTTVSYTSSHSSAEWIEEDPSTTRSRLVPLDDFGTVSFTNGSTISNGTSLNLVGAKAQQVLMVNQQDQPVATPSALGGDGAGFSVTWQ